jgi:hypothetical protein
LTLREKHRLRVFENRVLRRIFGPKRDGVTGGWRKLRNEEHHNLYSSPSIIRDEMGRACSMTGENECTYGIGGKARRKEMTRKTKAYLLLLLLLLLLLVGWDYVH